MQEDQGDGREVRDLDILRVRLHVVKASMDGVRAEPRKPSQVALSVLQVATVPVAVACGAIRLAATHDPMGFFVTIFAGGLVCGAMIAVCIKWHPRETWLASVFWTEMIIAGLAAVLVGACAMDG